MERRWDQGGGDGAVFEHGVGFLPLRVLPAGGVLLTDAPGVTPGRFPPRRGVGHHSGVGERLGEHVAGVGVPEALADAEQQGCQSVGARWCLVRRARIRFRGEAGGEVEQQREGRHEAPSGGAVGVGQAVGQVQQANVEETGPSGNGGEVRCQRRVP